MIKVLKAFSIVVICLFTLSIFGWMSIHISKGDKEFGFLREPIKFMYSFPDMFSSSVDEAQTRALPKTFIKTPENFKSVNKLQDDLLALISYSDTNDTRTVALKNLRDDSVLHKWFFKKPWKEHKRIWHALLLPDKNLVCGYAGHHLMRVDSLSNVLWEQDSIMPHHSISMDAQGDIWICGYAPPGWDITGTYTLNNRKVPFRDEYLVKVDQGSGEIIFIKSMAELLAENGLSNYLLKSGNVWDPIHINDIEPALKTTPYFQKDDLFISAKNLSVILHYRPSTNELIDLIEGPFVGQHDVDFYQDTALVFFNNNQYRISNNEYRDAPIDSARLVFAGDLYSQIVCYNLKNKQFSFLYDSAFQANEIYSGTEGLIAFYKPNTCFVEEQNKGVLWVIEDGEVIYKDVQKSIHKGYHNLPNWTRIINAYE